MICLYFHDNLFNVITQYLFYPLINRSMWQKLNLLISIFLIIIMEAFAPQLALLFTTSAAVASIAVLNLRIEILGQVLYAVFTSYHALALGAGKTVFVMLNTIIGLVVVRIVLSIFLNFMIGLPGIYWACVLAPVAAIPMGQWFFYSKRWEHSLVDKSQYLQRES